jgi:transposase-like protein
MAKGKYYTPEFKEQAVKMVVESSPITHSLLSGAGTGC